MDQNLSNLLLGGATAAIAAGILIASTVATRVLVALGLLLAGAVLIVSLLAL